MYQSGKKKRTIYIKTAPEKRTKGRRIFLPVYPNRFQGDVNKTSMDKDNAFNREVGLRIRCVRERMHLTRAGFGVLCGISESFLAAVEGGKKSITVKTLFKICEKSHISADYIIFGEPQSCETERIAALVAKMSPFQRECAMRIIEKLSQACMPEGES